MNLRAQTIGVCFGLGLIFASELAGKVPAFANEPPAAAATDDGSTELVIPEAFAPFETMIGSWKGTGFFLSNRVRGWQETHAWAWKFEKGTPVGLTVTFMGDKTFEKATLTYDAETKTYLFKGEAPNGAGEATFTGKLDKSGKGLTLDRERKTSDGAKQRLAITPNSNFVRYTLKIANQEAGAPQFKPTIEVGLTKEGEAFAAGGTAAELPKCIITGGASTMSVTYNGKTYPLCCTGCRDEFNENPEKYIKKAALSAEAADKAKVMPATVSTPAPPQADEPSTPKTAKSDVKPKNTPKAPPSDDKKAQSLLKLGQNLEKSGKTKAALDYYRQIVKEHPKSPAAKTAAERIKALAP